MVIREIETAPGVGKGQLSVRVRRSLTGPDRIKAAAAALRSAGPGELEFIAVRVGVHAAHDNELRGGKVQELVRLELHAEQILARRAEPVIQKTDLCPVRQGPAGEQRAEGVEVPLIPGTELKIRIPVFPLLRVFLLVMQGMIDGKSAGPFLAGAAVEDGRTQRTGKRDRVSKVRTVVNQIAQVHQVIPVSETAHYFPEVRGRRAQGGKLDEQVLIHFPAQRREEISERGGHLLRPFQSQAGKGQSALAFIGSGEISVHNTAACVRAVPVLFKAFQKGIVPSGRGLGFLGSHHIPGKRGHGTGDLRRAHETGVKPDPGELLSMQRVRERLGQFRHGQTVIAVQLVHAYAAQRTGPVVPEQKRVLLRGTRGHAVVDEIAQRFRTSHVHGRVRYQGAQLTGADDLADGDALRVHAQLPGTRTAGHEHDAHLAGVGAGFQHFQNVIGGRAVLALQIGSAHVDHQCEVPGCFAFALCGGECEKQAEHDQKTEKNAFHERAAPCEGRSCMYAV